MANAKCLNCDARFELRYPKQSMAKLQCPKCGNKATVKECYEEYDKYIKEKQAVDLKKKEQDLKRKEEELRKKEKEIYEKAVAQQALLEKQKKEEEAKRKAMLQAKQLEEAKKKELEKKKMAEAVKKPTVEQIKYKDGIYTGDVAIVEGKRVRSGYGTFKSNDGDIYKGSWANNVYEGEGELIFSDGFFEAGTFVKGKLKEGKAKRHLANGYYAGDIDNYTFDGKGKIVLDNGQEYEGEFSSGKRNGKGSCTYPTGEKYVGFFENDMRQGKGTLYYPNGSFDEANWTLNKHTPNSESYFHDENSVIEKREYDESGKLVKKTQLNKNTARVGQVIVQTPSGLFIGDVKNNKINGVGTYYYNNGDIYEGEFRDNKINGNGIYHFGSGDKKGDRQEGSYIDNVITGQAFYYYKDGRIESRHYNPQGKLVARKMLNVNTLEPDQRVVTFSNGDIYVGQVIDGERCGKGTYYFVNGERYEGFFRNNKRHGVGTYFYTDGSYERGSFESGTKNGPFIFTKSDGRKENRIYSHDVLTVDSIYERYKDWAEV